jgi:hypothetical protein
LGKVIEANFNLDDLGHITGVLSTPLAVVEGVLIADLEIFTHHLQVIDGHIEQLLPILGMLPKDPAEEVVFMQEEDEQLMICLDQLFSGGASRKNVSAMLVVDLSG